MNDAGLDRVRKDLEAMKQAAAVELPFGREDLKWGWIDGLIFVPLAAWAWFGPGTYMRITPEVSWSSDLVGPAMVDGKFQPNKIIHTA